MIYKVTELKKNKKGFYDVTIDKKKYELSENIVVEYRLVKDKEIDSKLLSDVVYKNELDKYSEAEKNLLEALHIFRKFASYNQEAYLVYVAWTYNNIADVKNNCGKKNIAIEYYKKALEIYHQYNKFNPKLYLDFIKEIEEHLYELTAQ